MKTILTTLSALLVLAACTNPSKNSLCDCVEKGAQVDAFTQEILITQEADQAKKDSLDAMILERDKICEEFIDIDPLTLEEERAKCEGIQINRD